MIYQLGGFATGAVAFNLWTVVAAVVLVGMLIMLFRPDPYKESKTYAKTSVQAVQ